MAQKKKTGKEKNQKKPCLRLKPAEEFGKIREKAPEKLRSARSLCAEAAAGLYKKTDSLIRMKHSAALITVFFLLLMLFTYSLTPFRYLFGNFPLYTTRTTQFYLIDYSVGFVSRALVGHIISLFTDKVSMALIVRLTHVALWLSLILQSSLAALAFKKSWLKNSPLLCALFVLFVMSHHTVIPNVVNFGVLDTYNLLLAILYVYISDTKAAYILTPVICFTGIILHYEFVLAYITFILSAEVYYIVKNKKGRFLRTAVFFFTVLSSVALTIYLMFFSKYHTRMDASELYDHMASKYTDVKGWGLFEEYFTYYIYGDYQGANYSSPADFIKFLTQYSVDRIRPFSHICYALSAFPVFGVILYFWIYIFKRAEKRMRLPYFVFMLQPLMLVLAMVISTDTSRWAGANFFSNFMLLWVVLRSDEPLLLEAAKKITGSRPKKAILSFIIIGSYALTVYIYSIP